MPGAAETARLIASLELKDKLSPGLKTAGAGLDQLDSKLSRIGMTAQRGLGNAARNIAQIGVIAGVAAVGIVTKSIAAASDLNETISKSGVVFGQASADVLAWSKTSAAAIGQSQNAALGAAATYGNLFVSMGFATDKSADMSKKLVTLAGDLASFNNIDPSEAADKLRAGLTGESEPLKSLGININETIIKAKALELGLVQTGQSTADLKLKTVALNEAQKEAAAAVKKYGANSTQALTATVKAEKAQAALEKTTKTFPGTLDAATKAQAAYALIFEQTATAQGDFARTSDGLANQQRILRANFENTAAVLGTALLPKVSELVKKINTLVVSRQPDIERLASKLPAVFDKVMTLVTALPWESIESAFKVMGMGAEAVLSAFTAMPPWVQTAVLTGWGLNKLTGGALGSIVGELGKGLIKGVLGMNAGVVNLNAASVTGIPGVGGAAAGAAAGGLGLASKVFLVGEAIGLALLVNEVRNGIAEGNTEHSEALVKQTNEWLAQNPSKDDLRNGLGAVETGIKELATSNLPLTLVQGEALDNLRLIRQLIINQIAQDNSPDARQARADLHKMAAVALLEHRRGERGDDRLVTINGTLSALQTQMHTDLLTAIGVLKASDDATAIGAAVAAAVASITGGAGSAATTTDVVGTLKTQLAAAQAAGNTELAAKIKAAIKEIEPFAKGRQWQADQIAEARKIVTSNRTVAEKVAALKSIEQDLLSHQRTMASGIVGGLLDVVNAVKAIKLPAGQTPTVNPRTGFVTGGTPAPKSNVPKVNPSTGFVITATINNSIRDTVNATVIRSRIGPTPVEAGSA